MGDVIDAIQHREKRRDLGWSEPAALVNTDELLMKWYLRGNFTVSMAQAVCGQVQEVAENAVITVPMTKAQAENAAAKLGAVAMLRVL
jgi:hypothetical protein